MNRLNDGAPYAVTKTGAKLHRFNGYCESLYEFDTTTSGVLRSSVRALTQRQAVEWLDQSVRRAPCRRCCGDPRLGFLRLVRSEAS